MKKDVFLLAKKVCVLLFLRLLNRRFKMNVNNKSFNLINANQISRMPLQEVVKTLNSQISNISKAISNLNQKECESLRIINRNVRDLCKKESNEYKNTWKGFFKRIFSCFYNTFSMGKFISTGDLGLKLTTEIKDKIIARQGELNLAGEEDEESSVEFLSCESCSEEEILVEASSEEDSDEFLSQSSSEEEIDEFLSQSSSEEEDEDMSISRPSSDVEMEEVSTSSSLSEEDIEISPKDQFTKIFTENFEFATPETTAYLTGIIHAIFKDANLVSCNKTQNPGEFSIVLDREIVGQNDPNYGIQVNGRYFTKLGCNAVLKSEITLQLTEELTDEEKNISKQIIHFTNGGFIQRFGGWTPDVELTKVTLVSFPGMDKPLISIGAGKYGATYYEKELDDADNILQFWSNFVWN